MNRPLKMLFAAAAVALLYAGYKYETASDAAAPAPAIATPAYSGPHARELETLDTLRRAGIAGPDDSAAAMRQFLAQNKIDVKDKIEVSVSDKTDGAIFVDFLENPNGAAELVAKLSPTDASAQVYTGPGAPKDGSSARFDGKAFTNFVKTLYGDISQNPDAFNRAIMGPLVAVANRLVKTDQPVQTPLPGLTKTGWIGGGNDRLLALGHFTRLGAFTAPLAPSALDDMREVAGQTDRMLSTLMASVPEEQRYQIISAKRDFDGVAARLDDLAQIGQLPKSPAHSVGLAEPALASPPLIDITLPREQAEKTYDAAQKERLKTYLGQIGKDGLTPGILRQFPDSLYSFLTQLDDPASPFAVALVANSKDIPVEQSQILAHEIRAAFLLAIPHGVDRVMVTDRLAQYDEPELKIINCAAAAAILDKRAALKGATPEDAQKILADIVGWDAMTRLIPGVQAPGPATAPVIKTDPRKPPAKPHAPTPVRTKAL